MANGEVSELKEQVGALWAEVHRLAAEIQRQQDTRKRQALTERQAVLLWLAVKDEQAGLERTVKPSRNRT